MVSESRGLHVANVAKGFLRRTVVYLKDHSPYPDSSLFVVNFKIQLELICWATTPLVVITLLTYCLYLHTQPINESTVVLATRLRYTSAKSNASISITISNYS